MCQMSTGPHGPSLFFILQKSTENFTFPLKEKTLEKMNI